MDEKLLQAMLDISQQLGNLNGNMNGVLTQLTNHNQRIQALEEKEREKPKSDFKDEIIKLLVKCLLIGATTVATLTGAGSLVSRVLPEPAPATQSVK